MKFDVFLCHNSSDKEAVKKIGEQLRAAGLNPWLDEWELRPGVPWQKALEQQIATIGAAAIFVGPDGFGPWQDQEKDAFLRQFVKRSCPVIPVILAECQAPPQLPIFLEAFTWVDFRKTEPPPLERLIWGITGIKPAAVLPGAKGAPTLPLGNSRPTPSIFVSYAHADAAALKQLKKHFAPLEREGLAKLWTDESIDFGSDWDAEIAAALDGCRFAVPVLSAAFFASKYITGTEIPRLLERQAQKEVELLPIFWSPCAEPSFRQKSPNGGMTECRLSKWQGLGRPEKTLKDMSVPERERALGNFVQSLRKKLGVPVP